MNTINQFSDTRKIRNKKLDFRTQNQKINFHKLNLRKANSRKLDFINLINKLDLMFVCLQELRINQ